MEVSKQLRKLVNAVKSGVTADEAIAELEDIIQKAEDLELDLQTLKRVFSLRPKAEFSQAFMSARKLGLETFFWNGQEYHTKHSEEMKP